MSEYDHTHTWEPVGELCICSDCGRTFGDTSKCPHANTYTNRQGDEVCNDCGEVNEIEGG